MVSVHVREDVRCGLGQWVRGGLFVVPGLDPAHHAEAADVIQIDGLKPEETEIGEVYPVAAILVASKVCLSNGSEIGFWHRLGVSNQGRSGSPKWVAISARLRNEEAASRVSLQILGVHGHVADEEDGPTCGIEGERHQGPKGGSRVLAR